MPDGRITVMGATSASRRPRRSPVRRVRPTWATNAQSVSGRDRNPERARRARAADHYLGARRQRERQRRAHHLRRPVRHQLARLVFGKLVHRRDARTSSLACLASGPTVSSADPTSTMGSSRSREASRPPTPSYPGWASPSGSTTCAWPGSDSTKAFTSLSTRLLFHTGWRTRDEIALQYAYFRLRQQHICRDGISPECPAGEPGPSGLLFDRHYWW